MRKRVCCLIISVMILIITVLPVCAVQPRWSYTGSVTFSMYFDGEEGSLEGSVCGYSNVTKIDGTITLYYKNFFGIWTETGNVWSMTTYSDTLYLNHTFDAESGKQYKAVLDVDVYSGSNSENITDDAFGTCP